jgi:hypothetical protein
VEPIFISNIGRRKTIRKMEWRGELLREIEKMD